MNKSKKHFGYKKPANIRVCVFLMVPMTGLEPAYPCEYGILSPARLPFHHIGIKLSFAFKKQFYCIITFMLLQHFFVFLCCFYKKIN